MRTPIRPVLLLAVAGLAFGLSACGGGEPADARDESGSSAEESSGEAADVAALEGDWRYTGDTSTDVASLTIGPTGEAKYFVEGDTESYAGTVEEYGARDGEFADAFKLHMSAVDQDGDPTGDRFLDLVLRLEHDGEILRVGTPGDDATRDFRPLED